MMHAGVRFLFAGLLLCVSTAVWSTTYNITTTADLDPDRDSDLDECSIRDAIEAINTEEDVNGCDAGTGNERIRLEGGETYVLEHGELEIGREGGEDEDDVTPRVRFQLQSGSDNAVLEATQGSRAFTVVEGADLRLESLTVRAFEYERPEGGEEGSCAAEEIEGDGGLIHSSGELQLFEGSQVTGGRASGNGGGIFVTAEGLLVMEDAMVADNCAGGDGGGVYLEDFSGGFQARRFYVGGNSAEGAGGGLLASGDASATFVLESGSFAQNTSGVGGSGMELGENHRFLFNNLTFAANSGGVTGFLYSSNDGLDHWVTNSTLVGNQNSDCDDDSGQGMAEIEAAYVVTGDQCEFHDEDDFITETAGMEVLRGHSDEGKSEQCDGGQPLECLPISAEKLGADFPGYLPHFPPPGETDEDALLLNGGSRVDDIDHPCVARDQRDLSRTDRCDIGALEFQVATGSTSVFDDLGFNESRTLDVVENDLGDTEIDCTRLDDVEAGDSFVLPGVQDEEWSDEGTCIYLAQDPSRNVRLTVEIDEDGYPTILYEPRKGYDGWDFFGYRVEKEAFEGKTFADRDVSARTSVRSRKSGFEESENIDDFISPVPAFGLVFVFLAGLVRRSGEASRVRAALGALLLIGLPGAAFGADITVNSLEDRDPFQPEPGKCTLRGAIDSAMDEWQSSSYCSDGRKGTNTIVIEHDGEGVIELDNTLFVEQENNIVIEGQGVEKTTIRVPEGETFRLMEAESNVSFRNLTLKGGRAGDGQGGAILSTRSVILEDVIVEDNTAAEGGAVHLTLSDRRETGFVANRVHFLDNHATDGRGGVLSTVGQQQEHTIEIMDTTFEGNSASDGGGVFNLNLPSSSRVNVANSTFYGNEAPEGSVLTADNLADGARVNLMNSSFLNNEGSGAFVLPEDGDAGRVSMGHSFYLAGNGNDGCKGGFHELRHNLFAEEGTDCFAHDNDDDATNEWGYDGPLTELQLVAPEADEDEDRFTPPFVRVTDDDEDHEYIIDAGSDGSLEQGFNRPMSCRIRDKRDETREAGEACDLGAYEFQSPTAAEIEADNQDRSDRVVIVDNIFEESIRGDGFEFLRDSLSVDRVENEDGETEESEAGKACVRPEGSEDIACSEGDVEDDEAENHVIRYEAPGELDEEDRFTCDELPVSGLRVEYSFDVQPDDNGNNRTVEGGLIDITIHNVPPSVHSGRKSFRIRPGQTQKISMANIEDPDGPSDRMRLRVPDNDKSNFARSRKKDPECDEQEEICEFERLGEGLKLPVACSLDYPEREEKRVVFDDDNGFSCMMPEDVPEGSESVPFYEEGEGFLIHPSNRTLVYKHGSTFKRFRDRFTVEATDECGARSRAGYEITFPEQSSTSDDVISSLHWWHLLALGLAALARRRALHPAS